MGLGGLASALAKGIDGYTSGKMIKEEKERQAREDAWRESERKAVLEERQRNADMRQGLSDAIRPAQVDAGYHVTDDAGSNAFTKDADAAAAMQDMASTANTGVGLARATRVNQTAYTDPAKAQQAANDYNADSAVLRRASAAVMPLDPVRGLQLRTGASQAEEQDRKLRERIKEEGVMQTVRAMRTGDPQAVKQAFNANGQYKIDGDLTVKRETRKAPWGGEVETFTYTGTVIDDQGNRHAVSRNSFDEMVNLLPFKDLYETESKAGLERGRHEMSLTRIKARGEEDRRTDSAKVRTTSGSSDNLNREERLRYTTLFNEAGRRMSEAQKTLSALQGDAVFMLSANKPGTAQAQRVQELNDAIRGFAEKRSTYERLLAQSPTQEGVGLRNAAPGPANSPESGLRDKVSGDFGAAPGARDREIAAATADLQRTSDPEERQLLQDYIAQMQSQNARYGSQPAARIPLKVGQVMKGYRFNGGDPNDKANWTKVN